MKTKCLIVDDEPLAIEVIEEHINKIDCLELAGTCNNAFEAFNFLRKNKVDLLFLDIHMPEMKGTDMLKGLKNPPKVIFTTAYREYALEGYELNVLDYLLKPVSFERFIQAIDKYLELSPADSDITFHSEEKRESSYIYVREKNQVHKIQTDAIDYIESYGDYVIIHNNNRKLTVRSTITTLEGMLPKADFIRIHRSYIIGITKITRFTAHSLFVNEHELPIGPSYRKEVFKELNYPGFSGKETGSLD